ncbi:uncharacterized protein LOC119687255 [Teleopsis dalmanni]|uniref:uncharacterized protein LOC119687255 n=1 Tax=Teleopsis dalmanni TaxID=139649 RepID=UPI0018CCCA32|nr:uncharacterized protein LOC119687255 [Teleopsis dalmanni]
MQAMQLATAIQTLETTPSRIPQRKRIVSDTVSATGTTPRPSRLSVTTSSRTNGTTTATRKTASDSASPAPASNGGMSRSSSIPALTGFGFKYSRQSRIQTVRRLCGAYFYMQAHFYPVISGMNSRIQFFLNDAVKNTVIFVARLHRN